MKEKEAEHPFPTAPAQVLSTSSFQPQHPKQSCAQNEASFSDRLQEFVEGYPSINQKCWMDSDLTHSTRHCACFLLCKLFVLVWLFSSPNRAYDDCYPPIDAPDFVPWFSTTWPQLVHPFSSPVLEIESTSTIPSLLANRMIQYAHMIKLYSVCDRGRFEVHPHANCLTLRIWCQREPRWHVRFKDASSS